MRRAIGMLLLLLPAGCRREASLELEFLPAERTVVLASWTAGASCTTSDPNARLELRVLDRGEAQDLGTLIALEQQQLAALYYPRDRAALGFPPSGPLLCARPGQGAQLPATPRLERGQVEGGSFSGWTPSAALEPPLSELELELSAPTSTVPCLSTLKSLPIAIERQSMNGEIQLVVASGQQGLAVVGKPDGSLYLVGRPPLPVRKLEALSATVTYTAGHLAQDGRLFLARVDGWLVVATPALDGVSERIRTPRRLLAGLIGSPNGAPFELFIATTTAGLVRYDGRSFELIPSAFPRGIEYPRMAWLQPRELLVVYRNGEQVFHVRGAETSIEAIQGGTTGVSLALSVPQLGPIVIGADAVDIRHFFRFDRALGVWAPFFNTGLSAGHISSAAAYQNGLLYVVQNGILAQYDPSTSSCAIPPPLGRELWQVAQVGPSQYIFGGGGDGLESLWWLGP